MPVVRICLVDAPVTFEPYGTIYASVGDDRLVREPDGALQFEVSYELRNGKPSGPLIQRQPDRRFVYLNWWGSENGHPVRFRRLKIDIEPGYGFLLVQGHDGKGGPACATARILDRRVA